MSNKYDVAIVGGGIVGLLTSLALAKTGCKIIHIEIPTSRSEEN